MPLEDWERIRDQLKELLRDNEVIGTLNFYNGSFYGFLLLDSKSQDKMRQFCSLEDRLKFKVVPSEEVIQRMQLTWGRGEHYFIF